MLNLIAFVIIVYIIYFMLISFCLYICDIYVLIFDNE